MNCMDKRYNISNIEEFLMDLGLSAKQSRVYLAALALGPSPVQKIATQAKIVRTNCYDAIEHLIARGLLSVSTDGKKRLFLAEPPEALERLLSEKQAGLAEILPQLRLLSAGGEHKPRIRYYPGLEGYRLVYEDTLTCHEKKLFGIYSIRDMWEVMGREYSDRMVERRIKHGIQLQVIREEAEKDIFLGIYPSTPKELRNMRRAPSGMVFPLTTFVYDHKVVILSSKKELFGLLIESQDIAQAHRNYFEALWQISAPG